MGISRRTGQLGNALVKADWRLDAIELVECNEAFAAQYWASSKELGFQQGVTSNGGGIALGHP